MIGLCVKRQLNASFGRRLSVTGKAVFITGCDTGLGNAIALALHNKGFTVFAGCLDVRSEGARKLMSNGVTALHVDYLEHDTIVAAYDNIRDNLNGDPLWGLVANAGVACYGETEWMLSPELEWATNVNILGTYKFIMLGINQIKRSEGRIVIVTGLHG
ncbi:D-beta-hydroxybutyrate dehydrogenase, mitochondrial-like [Haemaphysalis longicornis]